MEEDIVNTLKSLKNGKCKNPLGLVNEIFNEDDDSLLRSFFTAKRESPVRGDWVMMVTEDMKELGIDLTIRNEFIGK